MIHQNLSNTFQNMYSHPQIFPFFLYSGFHTIAFTLLTAPSVVPKSKRCYKISIQYNHTQYNYIQYDHIQYNHIQYNHIQYNHTQYNNIPIAYIIGNINCQKRHLSQFALHALSVFWTFLGAFLNPPGSAGAWSSLEIVQFITQWVLSLFMASPSHCAL